MNIFALGLLTLYCAWWCFWLIRVSLPPAPLLVLTGIPAPTTGCTRSLLCLMRGDILSSLAYNAFAVPIALLFLLSLIWLGVKALRKKPLMLPACLLHLWLLLLGSAWLAKLLGDPAYW